MKMRCLAPVLAVAAVALGACSAMGGGGASGDASSAAAASADTLDTAIVLLPNVGASSALQTGCWATFYADRNFNGDSLTLVGPVDLQTLDKGTARELKRDIKSVVTGPRATLLLYERQFMAARSVGFAPDSRESGLVEKLGFGGRVESMSLHCS